MPTTFRPCRPDRLLLLSSELRECLPPANGAHHVSDLADPVELSPLHASCEADGRRNAPCESLGAVDAGEDERYSEEVRGEALPAEPQRREKRRVAIARATVRLEAAQRTSDDARAQARTAFPEQGRTYTRVYVDHEPRAQNNIPGSESRVMNTSTEGFGIRKATERRGGDSMT